MGNIFVANYSMLINILVLFVISKNPELQDSISIWSYTFLDVYKIKKNHI